MKTLDIFSNEKIEKKKSEKLNIIADYREKNSLVISELESINVKVKIKHLKVGDYLIKDAVVERKTLSDFINSMINKRLIKQLKEIKQYPQYLLIIEGEENMHNREVHENALRGFLLSILLKHQVPILFTQDYKDTAKFLKTLIKRKKKRKRGKPIRPRKKSRSKKEQLQYFLEGFPGIGPKTAKKLLKKYKTIKQIINAPINDVKNLIGKKAEVFKLVEEKY